MMGAEVREELAGVGFDRLGNNTKFVTPPPSKAEVQAGRRLKRYDLQRVAANIAPGARVAGCCWRNVAPAVSIVKHPETKGTHYGSGVMHCGSVWNCPVCSAKITEQRRLAIRAGLEAWKSNGTVMMVTFTMQHKETDKLQDLVRTLSETIRKFKMGQPWKKRQAKYKLVGEIRAIETTVSQENGWHPHAHILFFSELPWLDVEAIKADFTERYKTLIKAAGGYASAEFGVDVKAGDQAAGDYLAKMGQDVKPVQKTSGLDFELAKAGQKTGRLDGHYTAFELLQLAKDGNDWAAIKFKEYVTGMKGINQLRWSKGLRELLGVGQEAEATDQDIAEGLLDKGGNTFYSILANDWKLLRMGAGGQDRRGMLLEVARGLDVDQFEKFINSILQESIRRAEALDLAQEVLQHEKKYTD